MGIRRFMNGDFWQAGGGWFPRTRRALSGESCLQDDVFLKRNECVQIHPTRRRVQLKSDHPMTEQLVQIWQRLLEKSPIHVEDNFFDLGGDSLLAVELFNAIAKECGRELPPVTIYQAPTIAALAELLNGAAPPRLPSLVTLNAGN